MVTSQAPRAFNREMYHDHPENVFYGTDDGAQDGSFSEFAEIKAHYESVASERRNDIHMISVVGGLYGLNLIPLWKPARITIFDINPTAVTYFKIVRDVFTTSKPNEKSLCEKTSALSNADLYRASAAQPSVRTNRAGNMLSSTSN